MTIAGKQVSLFVLINSLIGAVLLSSGAITAYADTLGTARWVSVVLGGFGVLQLLITNYTHEISSSSGPPAA
jgi:hypothetical protein